MTKYASMTERGKFITAMKWVNEWHNTTGALNKECIANQQKDKEWKCMLAQETAPYENIKMVWYINYIHGLAIILWCFR